MRRKRPRLLARTRSAWRVVLANIAQAVGSDDSAPRLMTGTGKDDVHLLVVCTAERGLCGGFNSSIARFARDHARKLLAQGKTVKIFCVGKKGYDSLRREFAGLIVERTDLREVKRVGFTNADAIGRKVIGMFDRGEFDVCTLFYSEFKSVISQDPDRPADHPGRSGRGCSAGWCIGTLRIRAGCGRDSRRSHPAQYLRFRFSGPCSKTSRVNMGAKMSAMDNATRNAGEMINKLTLSYNRQRQAQITKELIEIISGAEAL